MLWNIKAAENLISGDFVEFITDRDGKLSCKKSFRTGIHQRDRRERHRRGRNAHLRYERLILKIDDTPKDNLALVK